MITPKTTNGLRICLIGTSNSIYKDGYAGAIANDHRVASFSKFSMGASPSVIIPHFGVDLDFSKFDCIIFETAINDRNYYKYGSIRKDQIRQFIEWGVAEAQSAGCRVALLTMPSRRAMTGQTISGLIYQRIAAETGATILDGFDFVRAFAAASETCPSDLFIDDFHIKKPVAWKLGTVLIDKIAGDVKNKMKRPTASHKFFKVETGDLSSESLQRDNSLLSANFAVLKPGGAPLRLKARPGTSLVGVAYNAARSSGYLSISSSGRRWVKDLTTKYTTSGRELLLIAIPFTVDLTVGEDAEFRLECGNDLAAPTEQSRFEAHAEVLSNERYLEISSLLFRSTKL